MVADSGEVVIQRRYLSIQHLSRCVPLRNFPNINDLGSKESASEDRRKEFMLGEQTIETLSPRARLFLFNVS